MANIHGVVMTLMYNIYFPPFSFRHTLERFKILMEDTIAFTVSIEEYRQWQVTNFSCDSLASYPGFPALNKEAFSLFPELV